MAAVPEANGGGYEENCLLGYNPMQSVEWQETFRRNMSPPCLWPKQVSFILRLLFYLYDKIDVFLQNVD
jgi:hypothetical protein